MGETTAILIVDDDPQLCRTLSDILRTKGYAAAAAQTGRAALEQAAALGDDLAVALVDLRLPDMDGLEVVAAIQRRAPAAETVVLTDHASVESAVAVLRGEAFDYLQKPAPPDLLLATIERALERRARKQAGVALRESEARFRALVDTATDAIITMGADRRIRLFNRAAERIFGYTAAEIIGQSVDVLIPEEYGDRHRAASRRYLETGQPTILGRTVELKGLRKSGEVFPVELSLSETRVGGEITFTAIIRDITERKRTAATWRALNAAAAALQRAGLSEAEIYEIATEQLISLGLRGAVSLFDEATDSFVFENLFIPAKLLGALERLTGLTATGLRFPRERVPAYARVVEGGQALYVADSPARIVTKMLPESLSRLAGQVAEILGLANTILAPLRVEDRVVGVLHVSSDRLTEADVPAITAFADQLSAALENARLYQSALQATERRSILHRATQQIVRAARDLDQVYQAVHRAAAQLMPCEVFVIARLDETGQEINAVYLVDRGGRWPAQRVPAGRGLSGHVIASGETLLIHDFDPASSEIDAVHFGTPGQARSILVVPMRLGQTIVGVLSAQSYQPHVYSTEDQHLLEMLAAHTAVAVENARLFDETRRRAEETAALLATARAIASLDLEAVLETVAGQAKALLKADGSRIHLIEPDGETLRCAVALHQRAEAVMAVRLKVGQGITGRVALKGMPELIPNALLDPQVIQVPGTPVESEAMVLAPLKVRERLIGVMTATRLGEDRPFTQADLTLLTAFANQAAVAIQNAQLFAQTQWRARQLTTLHSKLQRANMELTRAYDSTLEGWARALELRDHETEGHSRRVTEMALRLACAMGIPEAQLPHIRRGALLHDIGKIGVPDSILLKPGPPTDEEWEIIHQHPVYAYEMLASVPFLQPALDIPYGHHERWDGGGYPRGLKEQQIPLPARIFAVVDVYDALRSNRPYRPAWPEEEARAYIREQAGRHFDPQVVEVFLRLVNGDG